MARRNHTPIDREFLKFIKYVPNRYLETIQQLEEKKKECNLWKENCAAMKERENYLTEANKALFEENETLKMKMAGITMHGLRGGNPSSLLEGRGWSLKGMDKGKGTGSVDAGNKGESSKGNLEASLEHGKREEILEGNSSSLELYSPSCSINERTKAQSKAIAQSMRKTNLHHPCEMVLSGNFGSEMDSIYQDETDWTLYQHPVSTVLTSCNPEKIHDLLKSVEERPDQPTFNPFPSHHLALVINDTIAAQRTLFFQALKILLEKCGRHVYYFTMCCGLNMCPRDWYDQLRDILRKTTNVKMVQLKIAPPTYGNAAVWKPKHLKQLKQTMECVKPFPVLQNLVTLDVENVPGFFVDEALAKNKDTVKKLQVITTSGMTIQPLQITNSTQLTKLAELSATFCDMGEIRQMKNVNWPLTTLTIRLGRQISYTLHSSDIQETFNMLQQSFGNTLETLRLTVLGPMDPNARLSLSKLQNLKVYFSDFASLTFIIGLESLTKLKVHLTQERKDLPLDIIKFNSYVKCMRKSNIWEHVPNLKNVEMTTKIDGATRVFLDEQPASSVQEEVV